MSATSGLSIFVAVLLAGAALSIYDLRSDAKQTIVVYTTPALRDLLEKDIVPRFERETGIDVTLAYTPVGQQYNRLRMSGERAEADLFLHASPLYLEKGYAEGQVVPIRDLTAESSARSMGREVGGGRPWYAFAWSPLVVVTRDRAPVPDLATSDLSFGFPHPLLSNNGVYAVILFEDADAGVGKRALAHTRVQPTNARANIGGVADGSFALTLGYEAVVRYFADQGADVESTVPIVAGEAVTTPVLFSVARLAGDVHPRTEDFMQFLFTNGTQSALARFYFRSIREDTPPSADLLDLTGARIIDYDWSRSAELETALSRYEVRS